MNGASRANGAIVSRRNSPTWPRALSVGIAKIVPASETVSAASPTMPTKWSSTSRASPVSPAPAELA